MIREPIAIYLKPSKKKTTGSVAGVAVVSLFVGGAGEGDERTMSPFSHCRSVTDLLKRQPALKIFFAILSAIITSKTIINPQKNISKT